MEYCVTTPNTFMYLYPDSKSEVTDELLYGTTVTFEEESYGGFIFCKTSYGYDGYVDISHLSPKQVGKTKYIVTSPFCDIYNYPEYRYRPIMTLVRGSLIEETETDCPDDRFIGIEAGGKKRFIPKHNIKKQTDLFHFDSEEKKRRQIIKTAFSYLGTPYRWGGKSTFGIDCSGLCFISYALCGLALYRDAEPDARYVKKISFDALKPADLIYYNGHVTMYVGSNEYIHSSATLGGVKLGSFDKNSPEYYPRLSSDIICCARSLIFE